MKGSITREYIFSALSKLVESVTFSKKETVMFKVILCLLPLLFLISCSDKSTSSNEDSIIEGDVICQNSDVEGVLLGKITVNELLSLKATAKITGDIITNKLSIEPGANFSGTVSMGAVIKDIKHAEQDDALSEKQPQKEKTA